RCTPRAKIASWCVAKIPRPDWCGSKCWPCSGISRETGEGRGGIPSEGGEAAAVEGPAVGNASDKQIPPLAPSALGRDDPAPFSPLPSPSRNWRRNDHRPATPRAPPYAGASLG